ncbi:MetQ/NlpA family ABC transporter substrate-binding protein [uncultured Cloacibacillus sp.]|uniref:MetQ/NlpA family ABC transporter substrate-binding protein n=1 Tax=uncultured Cloacibacillus sp. TaxID=889794 RepID=UPI0026DB82CC|nr:MetQ/NlpA family ABC transporter substrate-binding protein [uncultured Cloacibacillus sp.]
MKNIILGLAVLAAACGILLCSSTGKVFAADKKEIVVGGPTYAEVFYNAAKDVYEAKGYKTKFIVFDSNPVALEGCNNGEVDIALGMHKKFMESFNERTGGDLVMARPYGFHGNIGFYSVKHKSIDEIPSGAQIAIMNDAMNMGLALGILEDCGLIKLDHSNDLPTIADITENPKKIKLVDMDQAQTVTVLPEMDGACVFFVHMSFAGKDPLSYLAKSKGMLKFPVGVIVKKANENAKWATDFAECFRTKEFRANMDRDLPNVYSFYDNDADAE